MPLYTVSGTTPAAASGAPYCTFHTGSTRRAYLREIRIFVTAATASSVGLIRPSNTPTATTSIVPVAYDVNDAASTATMDTAWGTTPTIGSNVFLRKSNLANVQGAYDVWTFPQVNGLALATSSWYILWNYGGSSGAALDVTFVYEE